MWEGSGRRRGDGGDGVVWWWEGGLVWHCGEFCAAKEVMWCELGATGDGGVAGTLGSVLRCEGSDDEGGDERGR